MVTTGRRGRNAPRVRNAAIELTRPPAIPPLERIPDLGVSAEAAKLIRVAVWVAAANNAIDECLRDIPTKDVNFADALNALEYDFWIEALNKIKGVVTLEFGPDERIIEVPVLRAHQAGRGKGGGADATT